MSNKKFALGVITSALIIVIINFVINQFVLIGSWNILENAGFAKPNQGNLIAIVVWILLIILISYFIGFINKKTENEAPATIGLILGITYSALFVSSYFTYYVPLALVIINSLGSIAAFVLASIIFSKIHKTSKSE